MLAAASAQHERDEVRGPEVVGQGTVADERGGKVAQRLEAGELNSSQALGHLRALTPCSAVSFIRFHRPQSEHSIWMLPRSSRS